MSTVGTKDGISVLENSGRAGKLFRDKDSGLLDADKMSVAQAAKTIGVGQTNLRTMIKQGMFPVLRIGSRIWLLRRDCEAFLQAHYGTLQVATQHREDENTRCSALPEEVANSRHLR